MIDPSSALDPTGIIPSHADFRNVLIAPLRGQVDPTGVVPIGTDWFGIKIVVDALIAPLPGESG